jgi:hydroxyacylglutathione hydrolase
VLEEVKIAEDVCLVGSGEIGLSNPLDCHVYLLGDEQDLAMIDAGAGVESEILLANIKKEGLDPKNVRYLFLTHCHSDHACGGSNIKLGTSCEVLASAEEAPYIERGTDEELGLGVCKKANWYPMDFQYRHCSVDRSLAEKETVKLENWKITSLIMPGHSYGVLCLLAELGKRRIFFSSDSIFLGGTIGLGNWPGSGLKAYRESIRKLHGLEVNELYPGHGLWTLKGGQRHLDKAVDNLTYGWVPPIGSHNHPVY